jgi:hypothetical protein
MSKLEGMRLDRPRTGAPDYVKGRVGINVAVFERWMRANADDRGWVNLDLMLSKANDYYFKHNEWKSGGDPAREPTSPTTQYGTLPKERPRYELSSGIKREEVDDDMNDSLPFK